MIFIIHMYWLCAW